MNVTEDEVAEGEVDKCLKTKELEGTFLVVSVKDRRVELTALVVDADVFNLNTTDPSHVIQQHILGELYTAHHKDSTPSRVILSICNCINTKTSIVICVC